MRKKELKWEDAENQDFLGNFEENAHYGKMGHFWDQNQCFQVFCKFVH